MEQKHDASFYSKQINIKRREEERGTRGNLRFINTSVANNNPTTAMSTISEYKVSAINCRL